MHIVTTNDFGAGRAAAVEAGLMSGAPRSAEVVHVPEMREFLPQV